MDVGSGAIVGWQCCPTIVYDFKRCALAQCSVDREGPCGYNNNRDIQRFCAS